MNRLPTLRIRPAGENRERGQVIPFVVLMLIVLMGMAALAIDVSRRYSDTRWDRSSADAAALAGAQDLQSGAGRTLTNGDRINARTHALQTLVRQLSATGNGSCDPSVDIVNCPLPGTPFQVSVRNPAPSCTGAGTSTCDPDHSVQVTVHNPTFQTTFARLLGQSTWDVGATSVAGLNFSAKYSLVTLQPPKPRNNGTDANLCKDVNVSGNNTILNILQGDIGSNTSATTTNAGTIAVAGGYYIYHYDDLSVASCGLFTNPTWATVAGNPPGRQIGSLILDPNYMYASFTGAPTFGTQAAGAVACTGASYPTDWTSILVAAKTTCYRPGIYTNSQGFRVDTGNVAFLMPGAYSFPSGAVIRGSLMGGLISSQPGVVIVLPEGVNGADLDANNAENFVLNAGGEGCSSDGCRASPAVDFAGVEVKTPTGLTLTLEVQKDPDCFSGTTPLISSQCDSTQNHTVNLAGSGRLLVAGVIYGPSDNMSINGNSAQTGYVGQIVSWSIVYTGGSTLNQSYPGGAGVGIVRLDPACTAPGEPCVNP